MNRVPQMKNTQAPTLWRAPIMALNIDAFFRRMHENGEIYLYTGTGDLRVAFPVLTDRTISDEGITISEALLEDVHLKASEVVEVVSQEALRIGVIRFVGD